MTRDLRNTRKALLAALLEPAAIIKKAELDFDYTTRLALGEEIKFYPMSAVWDYYCEKAGVPTGMKWYEEIKKYEKDVLANR